MQLRSLQSWFGVNTVARSHFQKSNDKKISKKVINDAVMKASAKREITKPTALVQSIKTTKVFGNNFASSVQV